MFVPNSFDMNSDEIRSRIKNLRITHDYSCEYLAEALNISKEDYIAYEEGSKEFRYSILFNCAQIFNVDINEIIGGAGEEENTYSITRRGEGIYSKESHGLIVKNMAPGFRNRMVEPLLVRAVYDKEKENQPIELMSHYGQEFDYVVEGKLRIQIGNDIQELNVGDNIFYDSSIPHGMIAIGGSDAKFIAAMVTPEDVDYAKHSAAKSAAMSAQRKHIWEDYITPAEAADGTLESISFKNTDRFNFAFDVVDKLGDAIPEKTALLHLSSDLTERRFTFKDMKKESGRAANYLASLGIKKGDKVMLVMRRTWQYWILMLALEKLGAIAIPIASQMNENDYIHRFRITGISAIIAIKDDYVIRNINNASKHYGRFLTKISVNGPVDGWCNFDNDYRKLSSRFLRPSDAIGGSDTMLMVFQAVSNGMAVPVAFDCTYPLASFVAARYWTCDEGDALSLAVADSAWSKALWCKLFGPWLCETGVFTYDFTSLKAADILKCIEKYKISSFCAPASMFRALCSENLSDYDLSSLKYLSSSGDDIMTPEVQNRVQELTGIPVQTGFGLSETNLLTGTFKGMPVKAGSVGKANPIYDIHLFDNEGNEADIGEPGEMCVSLKSGMPCGLLSEYYHNPQLTKAALHNGYFHTGDLFWKDEDGYYWHIGRIDDVIRSSGYRIGPFEVESIIMELPFVLECGVTGVPDDTRGQLIKASIVLSDDKEPSEDLKTYIQNYVKSHTAPYRYPRIIEFRNSLPKAADGSVIRSKL